MKTIHLIKAESELGAGTRGSSLGVKALQVAAWNQKSDFFSKHPVTQVETLNFHLDSPTQFENALYIDRIDTFQQKLFKEVKNLSANSEVFPVVLAGDHSSASASIAAVKAANPDKRLGVVWVDAHGDLHSPYTTPSGNVHGMPLAISLNEDNTENAVNRPSDATLAYWEKLKNLGHLAPKVKGEDIVFFAVRDLEQPEIELMKRLGIKNFEVDEIRDKGTSTCVDEALERLSNCDIIYLSFDVDSMDCNVVSHGTGTPVENGLYPNEAEDILKGIINSGKVACFDVVEVNPTLDEKGNAMAEATFGILEACVSEIQIKINSK